MENNKKQEFSIGEKVRSVSFKTVGEIVSKADSKGFIRVKLKNFEIKVQATDLLKLTEETKKEETKKIQAKQAFNLRERNSNDHLMLKKQEKIQIDLHGLTVKTALLKLEETLDFAIRSSAKEIRIIHGRGKMALKEAVHGYLSTNKHCKHFDIALNNPGETVCYLD